MLKSAVVVASPSPSDGLVINGVVVIVGAVVDVVVVVFAGGVLK